MTRPGWRKRAALPRPASERAAAALLFTFIARALGAPVVLPAADPKPPAERKPRDLGNAEVVE